MFTRYSKIGIFLDDSSPCFVPDDEGDYIKFKTAYLYRPLVVDKIYANRYRVRSLFKKLVVSNNPSWFVTLTFNDPAARSSIENALAAGSLFMRRCCDVGVKALLVPERDKNKNWHFHGFIFGDVPSNLMRVKRHFKTDRIIKRFIKPLNKFLPVFSSSLWETGRSNLGWDDWTRLNVSPYDLLKVAKYTTKYVTKSFITDTGLRHRYLRSRGLTLDVDAFIDRLFLL
jgi:hypothetical protein